METPKSTESTEPAAVTSLPREGDLLVGKYRIDRVLGQGGMGVVVAAHHTTLRQKVAIKFLLDGAAGGEATERFLREARAAVSIQSEHVARVSDVGTLDSGAPYMVMEFLTGSDLGQVLEERGSLPVDEAVDYLLQACEAIAEAHSLGLIHRDLKPANLFLSARADGSPLVKVLDFGLSKATKPDTMDASLTAANVVMGSPYYMSPEQIRNFKTINARSDIWSLGVILYQMISGVRPFEADSLGGLFIAIGGDPVPPMRDAHPEIPAELEAAIVHCLEKDPKKRTQTVAEFAKAIAPFGAETARTSLDRILRVLSDPSASPAVRDRSSRTGPVPPVTTTPSPGSVAGTPAAAAGEQAVSAKSAALAPSEISALAPAGTSADKASPVKSGSMSAVAVSHPDGEVAQVTAPRRRPGKIAALVVVGATVAAAGLFLGLRGSGGAGGAGTGPGAPADSAVATATPAVPVVAPGPASGAADSRAATPADTALPAAPASAAPALLGRLPKPGASGTPSASSSAKPAPSGAPSASAAVSASATAAAPTPQPSSAPAPSAAPVVTSAPVVTPAPAAPPPPPPATTPPPAPAPPPPAAPPKTEAAP